MSIDAARTMDGGGEARFVDVTSTCARPELLPENFPKDR